MRAAESSWRVKERAAAARSEALATKRARSRMLPQMDARVRYRRIDKDRAEASLGLFPRTRAVAGVSVRQMVFNDRIVSRYLASGHEEERSRMQANATRMDVMAEAGKRFLQLLQARAFYRIERDDLQQVRKNLRLARKRRRIGATGPEDVYRWETRMAVQEGALAKARARAENARVALNRALAVDQGTRWSLDQGVRTDSEGLFLKGFLLRYLRRGGSVDLLRRRALRTALGHAPELAALDEAIAAAEIELARRKRRFYLPSAGIDVRYDRELGREDPDAVEADPRRPSTSIISRISDVVSGTDRDEWAVTLEMELPLFQGGDRVFGVRQAEAELARLRAKRSRSEDLIEQRVNFAVHRLRSSAERIRYARRAAERAKRNLDTVRSKYAEGLVAILPLIDAHNQAFTQRQRAVVARYAYSADLVELQRAMAWFACTKTQRERTRWKRKLRRKAGDGTHETSRGQRP